MRFAASAIGLLLLTAGCTTTSAPPTAARQATLQATQGRDVAAFRCAACHSIDGAAASPRANAPPFPALSVRFNGISWERAMKQIAEGGHDEMPPVRLDDKDIRDVRAFIESLR